MAGTWRRGYVLLSVLFSMLSGCAGRSDPQADACLKLKDLHLEHTQIVAADYYSAGQDISWKTMLFGVPRFKVPASCRVKFVLTPSADSHIESEVWMPTTAWNGRLWSVGNGGLAGSIDEISMHLALSRGYARKRRHR